MGDDENELRRLRAALELVQADLDRTAAVGRSVQLHVLVIELDPEWAEFGDLLTAFVAGPSGRYADGPKLYAGTAARALHSVADGVQRYLADVERVVWPICPRHPHDVRVRPIEAMPDSVPPEGGSVAPVWWCSGSGGHELAVIGHLGVNGQTVGPPG